MRERDLNHLDAEQRVFGFESGCAAEQPVSSLGERTGAEPET